MLKHLLFLISANVLVCLSQNISNCTDDGYVSSGIYCDECGLPDVIPNVRIVGGIEALPSSFFQTDYNGQPITFNTFPTSYYPTLESTFTVYLGIFDISTIIKGVKPPAIAVSVQKAIRDSEKELNDIALFILNSSIETNSYIKPACLPKSSVNYPSSNTTAYAAGWLLTEVDGLDKFTSTGSDTDLKSNQIFLIGATNRPDLIDPSLLRPGRFDKLVYVPIAKTKGERVNIFKALLRKLKVDPNFDIDKFIDTCPDNLTGADFYAITNRARQHALKRIISAIEAKEIDQTDTENIVINEEDFQSTLDNFVPTLNDKTLLDYEKYFSKYSSQNST